MDSLDVIKRAQSVHGADWTPTARELPPEGVIVNAMDSGGHVQQLVREGGLWFFPDRSMYVYYTPVLWHATD